MIRELMEEFTFNREESEELLNIIFSKEEVVADIVDLYYKKGCSWSEEGLINFIKMSTNGDFTIEEILNNMDCFYRLKSGVIISWDF